MISVKDLKREGAALLEEERSLVYTLILGVCMLLSLLLIGRMLLGRPEEAPATDGNGTGGTQTEQSQPQAPDEPREFQLTENDVSTLIVNALMFEPERIDTKITRDGTVAVSATVNRDTVLRSGIVSGGLRTAMMFLPEECGLQGEWKAGFESGTVKLECKRIEVASISLPENTAGAATMQLEKSLNELVKSWNITEISFEDGLIMMK